ncbi:hypothetical protein RLOC_00011247 [Lonchura striata]|uniref:Uncharacterized protein n=1 Tax=Lonchura striata TaxID=40157 RepID=A0A218V439_9PASE|nr:hypothetical protein RLOC_00011247 [Lonchura striata domestica]
MPRRCVSLAGRGGRGAGGGAGEAARPRGARARGPAGLSGPRVSVCRRRPWRRCWWCRSRRESSGACCSCLRDSQGLSCHAWEFTPSKRFLQRSSAVLL